MDQQTLIAIGKAERTWSETPALVQDETIYGA